MGNVARCVCTCAIECDTIRRRWFVAMVDLCGLDLSDAHADVSKYPRVDRPQLHSLNDTVDDARAIW